MRLMVWALAGALMVSPAVARVQGEGEKPAAPTVTSGKYRMDKSHASLIVRVSHLGFSNYTLRFDRLDGDLEINATNPELSTVSAAVDMTSISTGDEKFDRDLEGEKWLDAVKYPTAKFVSNKVERTGAETARVTGNLTFLGITQPMIFDVRLNGAGANFVGKPTLGFSARGVFNRSAFGLNTLLPRIGDMVRVEIETEFNKK